MLSLITKKSIILFDMEFYSQIDGAAMGSPLGPTLANLFLCQHEKKWLNGCPDNFRPAFCKRYVDDIFVLFKTSEHVQIFVNYLNSKHTCSWHEKLIVLWMLKRQAKVSLHKNISFSYKDGAMPFLDVNIFREKIKCVTNVYRTFCVCV